jgi:SAM-dependent methyltransferase
VRALEIGCATGIVVRYLNEAGIDAHGIDVSEWCIANREHPKVVLAGAEKLPYPDGYFDFVYSMHALEHLPESLKDAAFEEIRRVCPTGLQFHTLPMIGMGPYLGEEQDVRERLRKDPTHNLLYNKSWWLGEFRKIGFEELHVYAHFQHESWAIDMGHSQLLLSDRPAASELLHRLREWNVAVLSQMLGRAQRAERGFHLSAAQAESRRLDLTGGWADVELRPDGLVVTESSRFFIDVTLSDANAELPLRFCFITDGEQPEEGTIWHVYQPGRTIVRLTPDSLEGDIFGARIERILFGGVGSGTVQVALQVQHEI